MTKQNASIDVKHIAKLANLPLKDNEIEKFEKQLSSIVGYINTLNQLDTNNVAPTSQVTGLSNVFQDADQPNTTFSQEEAVSNAHESHNGMFVVEQILEEK